MLQEPIICYSVFTCYSVSMFSSVMLQVLFVCFKLISCFQPVGIVSLSRQGRIFYFTTTALCVRGDWVFQRQAVRVAVIFNNSCDPSPTPSLSGWWYSLCSMVAIIWNNVTYADHMTVIPYPGASGGDFLFALVSI